MSAPCFLLDPADQAERHLRRHVSTSDGAPPCPNYQSSSEWSSHSAHAFLDEVPVVEPLHSGDTHPHDDPIWPKACACGYEFGDTAKWQVFLSRLWKVAASMPGGPEAGTVFSLDSIGRNPAPAGALWYADWMSIDRWKGPDGRTLMCRTPGGDWMIDGQASNCELPDDVEHRCWCRAGEPPNVTVGKDGCRTCGAGGGSIRAGDYHGFLQAGALS